MSDLVYKSLEKPDDVIEFPNIRARVVELGDLTVGELEDRGPEALKGLDGEWHLSRLVLDAASTGP